MKNHTIINCNDLKICLRHNFEMAVITISALSGYSKALIILIYFCSLKGYGD